MKKQYIQPDMEIMAVEIQSSILTVSGDLGSVGVSADGVDAGDMQ